MTPRFPPNVIKAYDEIAHNAIIKDYNMPSALGNDCTFQHNSDNNFILLNTLYLILMRMWNKDLPNRFLTKVTNCSEALAKCQLEAAIQTIPLNGARVGKIPSLTWWDRQYSEAIKNYKDIECECHVIVIINFVILTIAREKAKKRYGWVSFCISLSPDSCPYELWRNIKNFRSAFNFSHLQSFPIL